MNITGVNISGISIRDTYALAAPLVSTLASTTTISPAAGSQAGQMLVLVLTNGSGVVKTMASGFTSIVSPTNVAGTIGYRVMQPGDTSFTLPVADYATLLTLPTGFVNYDANSAISSTFTVAGNVTSPTVTPTVIPAVALNIFYNANGGNPDVSPNPYNYPNLITGNVIGQGTSGMAISWTALIATTPFAGDTANSNAGPTYQGQAATILFHQ